MNVEIDRSRCNGCGLCVKDCVAKMITLKAGKAVYEGSCMQCGHCVAICPQNAVSIPDYDMGEVETYRPEEVELDPERLLRAIKFRRSVRDFLPKPVEREKIEQIIEAGRYTPTGSNKQDVEFLVIQDQMDQWKKLLWEGWKQYAEELKKSAPLEAMRFLQYYDTYQKDPSKDRLFFNAPVIILLGAQQPISAGLASENMEMMAVALGLGVMYDGYAIRAIKASKEAQQWIGFSEGTEAISCMTLGYPNVHYQRTAPRKKASVMWR